MAGKVGTKYFGNYHGYMRLLFLPLVFDPPFRYPLGDQRLGNHLYLRALHHDLLQAQLWRRASERLYYCQLDFQSALT